MTLTDKEKLEAIKKVLSIYQPTAKQIESNFGKSKKEYAKYVGLIHDIYDGKMTMTEVDDYIRDNF